MQNKKICRCLTDRKCTSQRDHWTMADIPDNDDKTNNSTNNEAEGRQKDDPSSTEDDTDTDDGTKPSKQAKKGKNEWKGVPDDNDIQVHPENNASADDTRDGSNSMKDIENIDTDIEIKKLEVERLEIQELIGIQELDREYQGKIEALTFEYATKKKALAYEYGEKTLAAQMEILDLEILKLTLGEEDTPPFQMYK